MSHRFDGGKALDINLPAFAVVSGAISGVTPKVSGWIRLKEVESMQLALTTTSTANVVWTADVAENELGKNAKALPDPPVFPTGTSQNATVTILMPGDTFVYLRVTATPIAGAGNANANAGLIVGRPVALFYTRQLGMFYDVPAADALAGTHALEYSSNWDGSMVVSGNVAQGPQAQIRLRNTASNPIRWGAAVDSANSAISIASPAGSGQALPVRIGIFEFGAIRSKFTPTSGAGSLRVYYNGKA